MNITVEGKPNKTRASSNRVLPLMIITRVGLFLWFCFPILISSQAIPPDSVSASDSTRVAKPDTLNPISLKALTQDQQEYNHLTSKETAKLDYRDVNDVITYLPYGFYHDPGQLGVPAELNIYGFGYNNISYLLNGISINNKIYNSLNLTDFQGESADSIEVVPLPRGFIYGTSINPVAVNFIPKDRFRIRPLTKLRYFQAPNEEGFVDVAFSTMLIGKSSITARATNYSTTNRFENSSGGGWKFNAQAKYLLSNRINFMFRFDHEKQNVDLNGGINYDSTQTLISSGEASDLLFDEKLAPANYSSRYIKTTQNNLYLTALFKLKEKNFQQITFYHQNFLEELRQNELGIYSSERTIKEDNSTSLYGGFFRLDQKYSFLNFQINAGFETLDIDADVTGVTNSTALYASAKIGAMFFGNFLRPSVFAKTLDRDGENFSGLGFDIASRLTNNFGLYAGYSSFNKPDDLARLFSVSPLDRSVAGSILNLRNYYSSEIDLLEIKASYSGELITGAISFIGTKEKIELTLLEKAGILWGDKILLESPVVQTNILNANFTINVAVFQLFTNFNFILNEESADKKALPRFFGKSGIYYTGVHFNNNLNLKTGINFTFSAAQKYQPEEPGTYSRQITSLIPDNFQPSVRYLPTKAAFGIDFFLAGRIQNRATVYFVFENLLDSQYYIEPYYPKQQRGMRLGVRWDIFD